MPESDSRKEKRRLALSLWQYVLCRLSKSIFHVTQFDDEMVQIVMNEALKYEGFPYVFGGDNPSTFFDCSGLTQWSYRKAGINLPRTAQQQHDATESIPLSEAKPGDLVLSFDV
ncbi:MAG: hypothetical protein ACFWT6_03070 [Virgibacillus proomii]|jgi:cell wall-associated NlpC family hydrolase